MGLTPEQLKNAFFNVLYSDSAGSAARAALGAGASSVIVREELNKASLPAAPFIVFQWIGQPSGGPRNREVKTYYPIWWLYDQSVYRHSRLEPLIPLIEAAYPEDAIKMCYLDFLPTRELTERAIANMPVKSMAFQIRTRG